MGLMRLLRGDVLSEAEIAAARAEGIEVFVERARCVLSFDDYRAPGKIHRGKKTLTSGGLLVTSSRFVLWGGGVRHLDLPRSTVPTPSLAVRAETGVVRFAWCAEKFHADRSGRVELSLTTPDSEPIAGLLA